MSTNLPTGKNPATKESIAHRRKPARDWPMYMSARPDLMKHVRSDGMNQLLLLPLNESIPEGFLNSLHDSGWNVSITADSMRAKQILQKGNVQGIIIEFNLEGQGLERLKVLRYVHETCPGALVVMLPSAAGAFAGNGAKMVRALNTLDDSRAQAKPHMLELYRLSPAQKRIAELVAQAYPNREIARRLKIKEQSVRNELSRIFRKMGIWNRVELALMMRTGQTERPKPQATAAEQSFYSVWPAEMRPPSEESATGPRHLIA
jgi:DNA-binding CsgD family transcriptional regulator